jgi:hypothetical protein
MYDGSHRSSPQEDQSWNGVFSNPNHSILMPKLTENTSRFFIHPEREIALLVRPVARRIGSGPLDDQWSFFAEIFSQLRVCGFVRLIALRPSEWIEGSDENPRSYCETYGKRGMIRRLGNGWKWTLGHLRFGFKALGS